MYFRPIPVIAGVFGSLVFILIVAVIVGVCYNKYKKKQLQRIQPVPTITAGKISYIEFVKIDTLGYLIPQHCRSQLPGLSASKISYVVFVKKKLSTADYNYSVTSEIRSEKFWIFLSFRH